MSYSTPAAKRRRLNVASHTLSQPFRSPLRTPLPSAPPPSTTRLQSPLETFPSRETIAPSGDTPGRPVAPPKLPLAASTTPQGGTSTVKDLKLEIHTLQQALDLITSGETDQVVKQGKKWREVARQAVDSMFEGVKSRVDAMGGVRGMKDLRQDEMWQDRAHTTREDQVGYGDDSFDDRTDTEGCEDQSVTAEDGEQEDFTMEIMLQTLNIDLKLIGYDKVADAWTD